MNSLLGEILVGVLAAAFLGAVTGWWLRSWSLGGAEKAKLSLLEDELSQARLRESEIESRWQARWEKQGIELAEFGAATAMLERELASLREPAERRGNESGSCLK